MGWFIRVPYRIIKATVLVFQEGGNLKVDRGWKMDDRGRNSTGSEGIAG